MRTFTLLLTLALAAASHAGPPQSAITYQGSLNQAGLPANGSYDFRFDLYDDPSFGNLLATLTLPQVAVTDGVFAVDLDYGDPDLYRGGPVYLEIRVGSGGSGPATVLSPRQLLKPAPLAISAQFAEQAVLAGTGSVNSLSIVDGSVSMADVDAGSVQVRVSGSCTAPDAVSAINADGTVTCQPPTTYAAGAGLTLSGTTFEVDYAGDGSAETAARSDHRHDELYGGGPLQVKVNAVGTNAENGAALVAALAAITDASAQNRYQVLVGPGVYEVDASGATMKPHVSLRGAGLRSTVITGPGVVSSRDDAATLVMADDIVVEQLTIRSTGGSGTDAVGVVGIGSGWLLRNARIEILSNGASQSSGFAGADVSGGFSYSGVIRDVHIESDAGNGFGSGGSSGDMQSLWIDQCSVVLTGPGHGLNGLNGATIDSSLLVTHSRFTLLAGGTGVRDTSFDSTVYRDLVVDISGGTGSNTAFAGAGSGFRPVIENSRLMVSGSDSAGVRTNNGFINLVNTTISASIGVDANTFQGGSFNANIQLRNSHIAATDAFVLVSGGGGHRVFVDHSTIDAFRLLRNDTTTGISDLRFGTTKLDLSSGTPVVIDAGQANLACVGSYDEDYAAVPATCQ